MGYINININIFIIGYINIYIFIYLLVSYTRCLKRSGLL